MEDGTSGELPAAGNDSKLGYFDALKIVALPLGSIVSVLAVVFYFAAGAWVEGIVQAEIAKTVEAAGLNEDTLIAHTGKIAQHDKDIEDNEEEIDEVDDKFTQFVRDVIAKL